METAFVLVPGAHTGGWVWTETAARLRKEGVGAYPATLTGMGGGPAAPGADLETHIRDVVRLIDGTDAGELVIVGHCYGIHPALAAADRRPERVARIVHLDTGIPRNGDPALELVPDQALRERLRRRMGEDGTVPPPPRGDWPRWGSTAGLSPAALDELARRAAPQPLRTLTRPLRLSGAHEPPVTGILCTENGSSIAMLESRPADPVLTDARVSFLELPTGHWPMLSAPGELTAALLRAAAGEGHRLAAQPPAPRLPFLVGVPPHPRERTGRIDLHLPRTGGGHPAIVFVHGGPVPPGAHPSPRDWPVFTGYAQYAASLGAVGVTLDHRLHGLALADWDRAAGDLAEAVDTVRADPRVDGDRIALWFFSAGGLLCADWLAAPPPWLRCVAATYPILAPLPNWGLHGSRYEPAAAVRAAGRLPIVLTRVEREIPQYAATVAEFLRSAEGADVETVDVPGARHGFETLDHTDGTRRAVEQAVRSVLGHLRR
jgi:pimeloyl-ACP methyl ester carboxylesterase